MARLPLNFLPTFVAVAQSENLRAAAEARNEAETLSLLSELAPAFSRR